ncbi:MAG: MFS transporter [Eubacterium sp.]
MIASMTKKKRNFLVFLISIMVQLIYIVPYIRFYFYDQYVEAYGLTNLELGNLGSIYGLVALFSYFVGGFFADRYSIRSLMTVSFIVSAGLALWEAMYPSYAMLIVIYSVFAFVNAATMWPAYIKFLRSLGTEDEQSRLFGVSEALRGALGCTAGLGLLAVVTQFMDIKLGVQTIIIALGISYIIFAFISFFFLPKVLLEKEDGEAKNEKDFHSTLENFFTTIKLPATWIMCAFMFSCYCTFMAGVNYLGTYTTQILGVSAELSSGLAIIRNYGILVLAGIFGGILADKAKSRMFFIIYLLIGVIVFSIIMPLSSKMVTLCLVLSMILPLFYYGIKAVYFSVFGDGGIPLELTGMASGIISFVAFTPDAFMTTLMGSWLDKDPVWGFNMIFGWMVVWAIVSIIFGFIIYKRSQKNTIKSENL